MLVIITLTPLNNYNIFSKLLCTLYWCESFSALLLKKLYPLVLEAKLTKGKICFVGTHFENAVISPFVSILFLSCRAILKSAGDSANRTMLEGTWLCFAIEVLAFRAGLNSDLVFLKHFPLHKQITRFLLFL